MNRSRFLKLGLGASLGVMAGGLQAARETTADALEQWARRHGGVMVLKRDGRQVSASPKFASLGEAMQELEALTEGPLRCRGRVMTGVYGGQPLRVRLQAA